MVFYIYKMKDVNYIGSTNDIKHRVVEHRYNCYNNKSKRHNLILYQYVREKQINIQLEILAVYKKKCSNKIQRLVEQFYINKYNSKKSGLNDKNAFINKKKSTRIYSRNYRKNNPKKCKESYKKWWDKNKVERNKRRNVKINCPKCNGLISKRNLKEHQRTKKCKELSKFSHRAIIEVK